MSMSQTDPKLAFEHYLTEKAHAAFAEKLSLNESILYSLLAPGKRVRPLLSVGFSLGFKGHIAAAHACGMAVEMIHTYSLIHDDLPAMDNDDFRRGRPTNHKVYGEATAILAGDTLLTFASDFLIQELKAQAVPATQILELVQLLMEASGHFGMVKGQALDMFYGKEDLTKYSKAELNQILRQIHVLKTGAIITWSCQAGLYSTQNEQLIKSHLSEVTAIGNKIGLLFQMVDDVLDVTASLAELGKTPGKDEKAGKLTYTSLLGLEGAVQEARELAGSIHHALGQFPQGDWSIIKSIVNLLEQKLPAQTQV